MKKSSIGFETGQGRPFAPSMGSSLIHSKPFEAGRVFDAVPPLLQAVEQLVELHKDEKVKYTDQQQNRIREFHQRLEKILPEANSPEVDLPKPDSY